MLKLFFDRPRLPGPTVAFFNGFCFINKEELKKSGWNIFTVFRASWGLSE